MNIASKNKNFSIPVDISSQLESIAKEMDLHIDVVTRNYIQILKYFSGPLRFFHALTEFENHYFRKNRKKYTKGKERTWIKKGKRKK